MNDEEIRVQLDALLEIRGFINYIDNEDIKIAVTELLEQKISDFYNNFRG